MTQQQLDQELAETLGEDIREIRRHGFSLATADDPTFDLDDDNYPAQTIDWDSNYPGNRVVNVTSFDEYREPRAA